MKKKKPSILVTNDDGITSSGIAALVEVAKRYGDVTVVAPDSPQSGMGHAITLGHPLRLKKVDIFKNIPAFECSGTPVDCVKIAVDKVLKGKPDFCFSGINHGSNSSINIIYSGTMSAAMEGAFEGIPSVGFSSLNYSHDADMSLCKQVVKEVIQNLMKGKLPQEALYNVNIPNVSKSKYKGLKMCRQADAKWQENYLERKDPLGKQYYWLRGDFKNRDKGKDTDEYALKSGYASVVPVQYDLTNYDILDKVKL